MSGFEIVGVVLGALPLIVKAVDLSKENYKYFFRKRKYVEKLALSLRSQQQHMVEITRSILISSGCEDVHRLDNDPVAYLNDDAVQAQVLDYLGDDNFAVFTESIKDCHQTVKEVAANMADLIPNVKGPCDNLADIIEANRASKSKGLDFLPRVRFMFGAKEFKSVIGELDKTSNSLFRLTTIISLTRQAPGHRQRTSRSAANMASALRRAHESAAGLHLAISRSWGDKCHERHETNLFLEDRIVVRKLPRAKSAPTFSLVFTATSVESNQTVWHETVVQALDDDDDDDDDKTESDNDSGQQPAIATTMTTSQRVTIIAPQGESPKQPKIQTVKDICTAIAPKAVCHSNPKLIFVLTKSHKIGTMPIDGLLLRQTSCGRAPAVSLKDLLLSNHGHALPLKLRMLLALRLASNMLQLLNTPWLRSCWSHDKILFPAKPSPHANVVDLTRPFISVAFGSATPPPPPADAETPVPKVALLELGILLLELWYEETLETHFALVEPPAGHAERRDKAQRWLDDVYERNDEPLALYHNVVSRCVSGVIGGEAQLRKWGEGRFWDAVCGDVVEPLFENCKGWR
ncbi:hypothetical protein OQA88_2699 [Cercophora sp. LCS_1]